MRNIDVIGKTCMNEVPSENEIKSTKGLVVNEIKKSCSNNSIIKGSTLLMSEDGKTFLQVSDKARSNIAKALLPYVNTTLYQFLMNKVVLQSAKKEENEYLIVECKKCKKYEIYHAFELANKMCNQSLCRQCGNSKYDSVKDVPFTDTFMLNLFSNMNMFFEDYMHKGITPPEKLLEDIIPYANINHPLEIGVVYDYIRNIIKRKYSYDKYELMIILEKLIDKAKENKEEFDQFLKNSNNISSLQSLQTTSDIVNTYKDLNKKINDEYLKFYYPHPLFTDQTNEFVRPNNIYFKNITNVVNLYKDTFDLIGDHWTVSSIANIIKNNKFNEKCITKDLFGSNLLNTTLKNVDGTGFEEIIKETYNVGIRNSIAHPGRFINPISGEVTIYNKGKEVKKIDWKEFNKNVEKLLDFHNELTFVKYRIEMYRNKSFLSTGGIISIQPDFFSIGDEEENPYLIINQLYPFKKYAPNREWWKDNIVIEVIEDDGITFSISRNSLNMLPVEKEQKSQFQ